MKLRDSAVLVSGSTVLVLGLGMAAISAVDRSFPGVLTGFTLFLAGYKGCQFSVTQTGAGTARDMVSDILEVSRMGDLLLVLVGAGMMAYGFVLLFTSFQDADFVLSFPSSALMFAGYAAAHYGINNTLV